MRSLEDEKKRAALSREIENVLDQEDGDPEETHHPEKQVRTLSEGESPEPEVAPIPAPRKRSWAKVWS